MQDLNDPVVRVEREAREAAIAWEKGRKANVELFTAMYLSLGPDAAKLNRHREELEEARGLAAHRWSKLYDLEAEAKKHPELKDLQDEAKRERRELESYVTKRR